MPIQPTYPGVYIEEVPSGARTIAGVSTSVTAFVGRTARGDVAGLVRCLSFADFERKCGGLWAGSELGHSVYHFFQNGGAEAIIARVVRSGTGAAGTASASLSRALEPGHDGVTLTLAASSPGAWGSNLRARVDHGRVGEPDEAPAGTFHLTITEEETPGGAVRLVENFFRVSLDETSPRFITRVLEQESALARVAPPIVSPSGGRPVSGLTAAFSTGGADGGDGTVLDYEAAIERLEKADIVNLLCVPPPGRDADASAAVLDAALAFCRRMRAMLIIDPPRAWGDHGEAAALLGGYDAFRSPNAAYYFPAILAPDPLEEGRARRFAPSGAVAGVLARTDATRGVWKAPAGIEATLSGVSGLALRLTDDENGVVNPKGVNALRELAVGGFVVWGARTAAGADELASEWKYLPVRRLALHIEESLARGTRWAVFEPNAEPLWAELRLSVGAFMHQLFRQGAFKGSKPADAYLVRCDGSTTNQADIDRGIVNVLVGFAPLKPAEFVFLRFQQMAGQATT